MAAVVPVSRTGQASGRQSVREQRQAGHLEAQALSVTHWFDSGKDGEPYSATVRFTGRRMAVGGKPQSRETFVHEETIDRILPGSGAVSVTGWVYGLQPGEWTVTADLIRPQPGASAHRALARLGERRARPLPPAAWSWRRWRLSAGPTRPVKTRWAPLVRLARVPAVIPGSWTGLVVLGVLVGFAVQAAILGRQNVSVSQSLLVDLVALLTGLIGAKLWYVAQHRGSWREWIGEGWAVDGFVVVASLAAVVTLLALNLPIGGFLDASAPALFFGVAIGRFGCFFTGCCAGRCTASRWGVWSSDRRVGARRVPTQLLESAAGLLIGVVSALLVVRGMPSLHGTIFVGAVTTYTLIRQFLLRLRAERHKSSLGASLTAAFAAFVLLGDAVLLLKPT